MKPPKRNQRLFTIGLVGLGLTLGLVLIFSALNDNTQFFYNPSDVVQADFEPKSDIFRIGGLVVDGSVRQEGITTTFLIDDFEREMADPIRVSYSGALPNLFREGQGVVISGRLVAPLDFAAVEVLAKHDENYQPEIRYADETAS